MMEEDLMMHLKNKSVCKLKVSKLAFYLALFFFNSNYFLANMYFFFRRVNQEPENTYALSKPNVKSLSLLERLINLCHSHFELFNLGDWFINSVQNVGANQSKCIILLTNELQSCNQS